MDWLISLLCGAGGGNLAGALLKKFSLGTLGNSVAGILGGGAGMGLMNVLGGGTGNAILNQVLGGGVGGGVVMTIIGFIKSMMAKK